MNERSIRGVWLIAVLVMGVVTAIVYRQTKIAAAGTHAESRAVLSAESDASERQDRLSPQDVIETAANDIAARSSGTPSMPPAALGSGHRGLRSDHPNSDRLVTESMFLSGNELNSDAVSVIIKADRFDEILGRMDEDMRRDRDAHDLAMAYESAIATQLGVDASLRLDRLACGLRLCAAMFNDGDEAQWSAWAQRFHADPRTPVGVFVEYAVESADGVAQRRLVFSTDPTSSGVTGTITTGQ